MKKSLFLLLAAAMAFVGCQKEEINSVGVNEGKREITLLTSADAFGPRSRMTYADGAGLAWNLETDWNRLGVTSNVQDAGRSTSMLVDETDGTVSFKANIAPPATHVLTYYPHIEEAPRHTLAVDNGSKLYTIRQLTPAEQVQVAAGEMDASNITLIGATPIYVDDGQEHSAAWEIGEGLDNPMLLTSAILRFRVYDSSAAYASENVESISVTVDGASPNADVVSTGNITETTVAPVVAYENGTPTSVVTLENVMSLASAVSAETTQGIYLGVTPYNAKVTYVVTTDTAVYTFKTSAEKNIEAGSVYDIALNLSSSAAVREAREQYVCPVLTKLYDTEIVVDGETVVAAASLKLVDRDGSELDFVTYKSYVSLVCERQGDEGVAEVSLGDDGVISIVFPENAYSSTVTWTLTASGNYETVSTVDFFQAKNTGGSVLHTFVYTIYNSDKPDENGKGPGFGKEGGSIGDKYRIEGITIDNTTYNPGSLNLIFENGLIDLLMDKAIGFGEITENDVQVPGSDPLTENPESFVTFEPYENGGAAIYIRVVLTPNDTGVRRTFKIITYDGNGEQVSSIAYFQNA